MKRVTILLFAVTAGFYALRDGNFVYANPDKDLVVSETIRESFSRHIGFELNLGQVGDFDGNEVPDVLFRAKLPGYGIFITSKGVSYVLYQREEKETQSSKIKSKSSIPHQDSSLNDSSFLRYARFDVELVDSDISLGKIEFEDPLPGYSNYYLAHCPDGVLEVRSYRRIKIREVYPGIDWVWRYDGTKIHHEFEVAPDANYSQIRMRVKWAGVEIANEGKKIIFSTPIANIEDGEIYSYEIPPSAMRDSHLKSQVRNPLDANYKMNVDGIIFYHVKNYSGRGKLIIDPPLSLVWATYYGGNGYEWGRAITTDRLGNVFIAGATNSTAFPTQNPAGGAYFQGSHSGGFDAFILKFSNAGMREWATYYGGSNHDYGFSITTDNAGNIFIAGYTWSLDFPTYNPGGAAYFQSGHAGGTSDAFTLKFSNGGVRQWATYYGGSDWDEGSLVTTDSAGNVFMTGYTRSPDFPTYNPGGGAFFQGSHAGIGDVFMLKFNNEGRRQWATYYGGSNDDAGHSIATDANGNVFATGATSSTDLPTYDPGGGTYFQGSFSATFILKFSNVGVRQWATYYGGSGTDFGRSITTGPSGNIFVIGISTSTDFPTENPGGGAYFQGNNAGNWDAFILKFDNSGVREWATYYGGSMNEYSYSIATDTSGNVFATGLTGSSDFPTKDQGSGAFFQGNYAGSEDAFILKFDNTGAHKWATYYGGWVNDHGYSIATDDAGSIFVTGETRSPDFFTHDPGGGAYFQGNFAGGPHDSFILKFEGETTDIKDKIYVIPSGFTLNQNYPNPFNSSTTISYSLPKSAFTTLKLYDVLGREVYTLVEEFKSIGSYIVDFDASNLPSGIYLYRIQTGDFTATKKMLLIE